MLVSTLILAAIGLIFPSVLAQDTSLSVVQQAFLNASLVPDVLASFNPSVLVEVVFPNNVIVNAGIMLTMSQTLDRPQFSINTTDVTGRFVVIMIDPDAPSPQNRSISDVRHMIANDMIPTGNATQGGFFALTNTSQAITDFISPSPPAGAHRYTILVYNQPDGFDNQQLVNANTSRLNFNLTMFAQQTGLGDPIGGTFFLEAPDNSTNSTTTTTASASATAPTSTPTSGASRSFEILVWNAFAVMLGLSVFKLRDAFAM